MGLEKEPEENSLKPLKEEARESNWTERVDVVIGGFAVFRNKNDLVFAPLVWRIPECI